MNKLKVNTGIVLLVLLACMFAGWEAMAITTVLLFLFCEVEGKAKDVAVKILTFYIGVTLVSMGWNLIYSGIDVITDGIKSLVNIINTYLDPMEYIHVEKIITPIQSISDIADSIVSFLITLAKFFFIVATLTNQKAKENPISSYINKYVSQAVNFINNINITYPQQTPSNNDNQPKPEPNVNL